MKRYPKNPLSEKWLKAAVVGSLWAAVEIVLGSFLHNLKIPLAGSFLSFITVYLVISFFQVWKNHGLIWRAGLICALMKSISPSAIIIGPMIGILSQAMILDLTIRLAGRNLFSYMLGGALAVFSALAQKALTLLILYGWDFVILLENLYLFATRQLGLEQLPPEGLLAILSLVYLFSGAMAGFMGFLTGSRYMKNHSHSRDFRPLQPQGQSDLFKHTRKNNHSISLLVFSFAMLVAGMVAITRLHLWMSAIWIVLVLLLGYWRYAGSMRYLRKPALWLQLGAIILLSTLLKNGMEQMFSPEGLFVGLKMSFRALLLLTCFAAISTELKNPVIKNLLYNRGFQNLYQSVELAFSALPGIMDAFYNSAQPVKGFRKMVYAMLGRSQAMLSAFRKAEENRKPVFILTGRIHQGKTSFTRRLAEALQNQGLMVRGFVTLGNVDNSSRNQYKIKNLESGCETILCSTQPHAQKINYGRFYFEETGIKTGCDIIAKTLTHHTDLLIVDELGPMEIHNQGWAPVIEKVVERNVCAQFWVVREKLVKPMLRKWNVGDAVVFCQDKDDIHTIQQTILLKTGFLQGR